MKNQSLTAVIAAGLFCIAAQSAMGQSNTGTAPSPGREVPADNTKSNKLDPSNSSATADAQKDNASDRTITQRIRKSIVADKSLSTYAHNVKIVSVNGTVTLNGVVRSDQEKSAIEAKAVSVAGEGRVVNDLKVAPAS
ncbi:MAG: transport-associated protein [Gammaproteobacteria bacterium]|nr:transport-associated protein [Gammaproteobacteria bacterium]